VQKKATQRAEFSASKRAYRNDTLHKQNNESEQTADGLDKKELENSLLGGRL
jgi:hypothetical protein